MRRSNRGYSGYRGRRTSTDILRIIAVVLGVLVVLAVAGLFYLQDHLTYTDDGIRVNLPFGLLQEEDPLPDPGTVSVVEQTGQEPESGGEEPQPAQEAAGPLRMAEVSLDSLLDGSAQARMEELGADALVITGKDSSGQLAWQSEQPLAALAQVNGSGETAVALAELEERGVYVAVRVCCFRDDAVPYYDASVGLRSGDGNWRDELGLRWMSPGSPAAQSYVAGLCGELAAMGVDEIVLEQFAFPTAGDLTRINAGETYDPESFSTQLQAFLSQVEQVLAPYETRLSLRVDGTMLDQPPDSGLTAALVEQTAARVWTGAGELTAAQTEEVGGQTRLVQIVENLEEGNGEAQAAVLN